MKSETVYDFVKQKLFVEGERQLMPKGSQAGGAVRCLFILVLNILIGRAHSWFGI